MIIFIYRVLNFNNNTVFTNNSPTITQSNQPLDSTAESITTGLQVEIEIIGGPEGWELPKKSKNNKEVAITFDTPGIYLYQCTPHATMGMIAMVVVGNDMSNLDAIKKMKIRGKSKKKMKELLSDL